MEAAPSACDHNFVCDHPIVQKITETCTGPWVNLLQEETIRASHGFNEATQYWLYRRLQPQWGPFQLWHGTTLDVAITIMQRGFCVGPSTDQGSTGAFGIMYDKDQVDHESHGKCDDICRRLCLDRVKIYNTDRFRTDNPEEACPCIIHAWVPQYRTLQTFKRFLFHKKVVHRSPINSMLQEFA